jgi:hypothetical protein
MKRQSFGVAKCGFYLKTKLRSVLYQCYDDAELEHFQEHYSEK